MIPHRAPLPEDTENHDVALEVRSLGPWQPGFLLQLSQTALLMNLATLITDTRRWVCSEPLLPCFSFMLDLDSHCSHLGHTLIRHQPADTLRDTLFVKCHQLESKMRAFVPRKVIAV